MLLLFEVLDGRGGPTRLRGAQKDVGGTGEHVEQLGHRQVEQQRGVGQHVQPPQARVRRLQCARIHVPQRQRDWVRHPVDGRRLVVGGRQSQCLQQETAQPEP